MKASIATTSTTKKTTSTKTKKIAAKKPVVVTDAFGIEINAKVLGLIEMMKKVPEQRTPGWYAMRANRVTASSAASVLRVSEIEIALRDAEILSMDAKKKVGHVMPSFSSFAQELRLKVGVEDKNIEGSVAMEHGIKYEDVIKAIYEDTHQVTVHEFGLVPHPTLDWLGASPDGIRSDGIMVEIKCPYGRVPTGVPKAQYWIQMQLQMFCCDLQYCDYLDCVIQEYFCREDYLADKCYNKDTGRLMYGSTAKGMPKGVMIAYKMYGEPDDLGRETVLERKYYPPPPVMAFDSEEEESAWIDKWIETTLMKEFPITGERLHNIMKHKEEFRIHYWYIETWNEVRVARNDEWLEKRIPEIHDFWKLVLRCREEGMPEEYMKRDKKTGKFEDPQDDPPATQLYITPTGQLSPDPAPDNVECNFWDSDEDPAQPVLVDNMRTSTKRYIAETPRKKATKTLKSSVTDLQASVCLFDDDDADEEDY